MKASVCRLNAGWVFPWLLGRALHLNRGFFKFPLAPATDMPLLGEQLAWRPVPVRAVPVASERRQLIDAVADENTTTPALLCDLSLPLKARLDEAKNHLIAQQRRLTRRDGGLSHHVKDRADRWTLRLRVLDAGTDHAKPEDMATPLFPHTADADTALSNLLAEAAVLCGGGHRRILLLES